jgi:hypothetical protein
MLVLNILLLLLLLYFTPFEEFVPKWNDKRDFQQTLLVRYKTFFPVDSYIIAPFCIFPHLSPYLFPPFNSCKFSILLCPAPLFIYSLFVHIYLIITILNFVISLFPSPLPLSIPIYLFSTLLYPLI